MALRTESALRPLMHNVNKAFKMNADDYSSEDKFSLLQELFTYFVKDDGLQTFSSEITSNYYSLLACLLESVKPALFQKRWQEHLFERFFLEGIQHDAFMILVRQLSMCSPSYEQDKILDLLEKFLHRGNLSKLFYYQCIDSESWNLKFVSSSSVWDDLITLLISLPERVANKTKGNMKKIFTTSCFIPLVVSSYWKTLQRIHERLLNSEDCSLQFLSKLLGRLCAAGHADIITEKMSALFIRVCETDFVWRRISQSLTCKMPSGSMEQFIAPLLMHIPWYGFVEWLLGDSVVSDDKMKFLITKKLLLVRQFKDTQILQNSIGYLATSIQRRPLFYEVLNDLLNVWEDGSLLRHHSYPHQYYLASAIVVCAGHLKAMDGETKKTDYLNKVLQGVQVRIGNPEPSVRTLGMIIGECLLPVIDPNAPELKFEHESSPELDQLIGLLIPPERPEVDNVAIDLLEEGEDDNQNVQFDIENVGEPAKKNIDSEELDSDDDLEPYDMSNDIPATSTRRPMYIRDCMLGLIERDKADWTEACLKSAEALIISDTDAVQEVAAEMAKLLLHLDDTFGIPNFIGLRHRALITLTVECPVQTAKYLTSQFYERNYNIRQRLDILEVLAAASQELSHPKYKLPMPQPESSKMDIMESSKQHWKYIVDKRVEAKSRRISQGLRSKKVAEPEKNRFSLVAGYFFFPLLEKYDRSGKMLDLFGDDSYVLGRLLHTLGLIMYSASNIMISRQMSIALFDFLRVVRHHSESFVRQSAIFALCTIFISSPPFLLVSELQDYVVESQNWLETAIEKDPDFECQVKAARVLALMRHVVQNVLPSLADSIMEM